MFLDLFKKELPFEWKKEQHLTYEDLKKKLFSTHVWKFLGFTKSFKVQIDVNDFTINGVLLQDGHQIVFESKKFFGTQLRWPTHKKELYVIVCCLKTWQHYFEMHKTKVLIDNISLKYFETQPRTSTKQLRWHDTLVLLDLELIHKLGWDNIIPNALSKKEEFQMEKPPTKTQALKAIFQGEGSFKWKIREVDVQDPLVQHYFKELQKWKKMKDITLKEGLFKWK